MALLVDLEHQSHLLGEVEQASPVDHAEMEAKVEKATQAFGRKLFRNIEKHQPSKWSPKQIDDALMQVMMKDEDLRYRMLLFVDVFPALKNSAQVASHLEEYLKSPALSTGIDPTHLSTLAQTIGKERALTRKIIQQAARFGITRMGNQFIAGNTPREVSGAIRDLEQEGFGFSLDLLGEFVVSESQANDFQRRYMEMISDFEKLLGAAPRKKIGKEPRTNISIKLSSLTSKFDPMDMDGTSEDVRRRLRPLLREAKKRRVFLNVDMEKYEYRDATLQILLDLFDEKEFHGYEYLGTVHQAYLKDAEPTLEWFLSELRRRNQQMSIRLVKGAYWDSEQIWSRQKNWSIPVYTDKRETDACYERCLRMLMENHDIVRTAIASHNVRSIARSMGLAKVLRVPKDRFEYQMLYGMAGSIKDAVLGMGYPVRIYTPCGELIPGMSYLVRRILENTSNESFLRQRFSENRSASELLSNPNTPRKNKFQEK